MIEMSPLPARPGRGATPGEDPARAGFSPCAIAQRRRAAHRSIRDEFLGQPHRGGVCADYDDVLTGRVLGGPRLSHG